MREIKFRVFDKCHKSMHIVGEDTHDSLTCYDGIVQYYNLQNGEGSGEHGDYILMQYTGLKDKNGREIYEGDIVEQELLGNAPLDFGSFIGVVKFIDGTYMIENAEGTFGVELFSETNPNEVIGNIYENPKLLEGSE